MPLSDVTCDKGECVTLRCKVCGRPKATVTWKGPDQNTLTNNGHFSIAYRYTVQILVQSLTAAINTEIGWLGQAEDVYTQFSHAMLFPVFCFDFVCLFFTFLISALFS